MHYMSCCQRPNQGPWCAAIFSVMFVKGLRAPYLQAAHRSSPLVAQFPGGSEPTILNCSVKGLFLAIKSTGLFPGFETMGCRAEANLHFRTNGIPTFSGIKQPIAHFNATVG
jgi:hypothetical protein